MEITSSSAPLHAADSARSLIRWGLYPLIWLWVAGCIAYGLIYPDSLQSVLALKGGVMVTLPDEMAEGAGQADRPFLIKDGKACPKPGGGS